MKLISHFSEITDDTVTMRSYMQDVEAGSHYEIVTEHEDHAMWEEVQFEVPKTLAHLHDMAKKQFYMLEAHVAYLASKQMEEDYERDTADSD